MKVKRLPQILSKTSSPEFALTLTLLLGAVVSPAFAQVQASAQFGNQDLSTGSNHVSANQDTLLPPEVVPQDPLSYKRSGGYGAADSAAPGLVSSNERGTNGPQNQMQSAKDFRNALMDSLAGKGYYPQFNNQNPFTDQSGQAIRSFGQAGSQPNPYNLGSPMLGQSDWMNADQEEIANNPPPSQTQTLTGGVRTPYAPYQGGNRYAHGLGYAASVGETVGAGIFSATTGHGGASAAYGLGYTGAALLNFGMHNGFRY